MPVYTNMSHWQVVRFPDVLTVASNTSFDTSQYILLIFLYIPIHPACIGMSWMLIRPQYIPCDSLMFFYILIYILCIYMQYTYPFWSLISIQRASGLLNSCIVFANDDLFAQWICKKDLASRRQSMMALGKRWFGFQRFKKCWCAFATRAKSTQFESELAISR